jgi:hypothetical protein
MHFAQERQLLPPPPLTAVNKIRSVRRRNAGMDSITAEREELMMRNTRPKSTLFLEKNADYSRTGAIGNFVAEARRLATAASKSSNPPAAQVPGSGTAAPPPA